MAIQQREQQEQPELPELTELFEPVESQELQRAQRAALARVANAANVDEAECALTAYFQVDEAARRYSPDPAVRFEAWRRSRERILKRWEHLPATPRHRVCGGTLALHLDRIEQCLRLSCPACRQPLDVLPLPWLGQLSPEALRRLEQFARPAVGDLAELLLIADEEEASVRVLAGQLRTSEIWSAYKALAGAAQDGDLQARLWRMRVAPERHGKKLALARMLRLVQREIAAAIRSAWASQDGERADQ